MIVDELRDLLGYDVLLLAWPKGSKGTKKTWGHLTIADMEKPKYLDNLMTGNIGVALGEKSGNLIALDVDDDNLVQPFIRDNPFLNDTLRTHGSRGVVFWLRMAGSYPTKCHELKNESGIACGEWRAATMEKSVQSIIHGIHPNGDSYQMVNRVKPLVVEFSQIVWPKEIINPPSGEVFTSNDTEFTELRSYEVTEAVSVPLSALSALSSPSTLSLCITSIEQAVKMSLPDSVHHNNGRLFHLARALKNLEANVGKLSLAKLIEAFDHWHSLSRPTGFLRPELTRDDYLTEFMTAYKSAKVPLGAGTVSEAWRKAQEKPLPPEAIEIFTDGDKRLVVALCRELQIMAGKEPFYLSARTLAGLLKHDGHATTARWLSSFCVMEILDEIEKGGGIRASRYRYKLPLQ